MLQGSSRAASSESLLRCERLANRHQGSEHTVVEGAGHALPSQIAVELNEWIERIAKEGLELGRALPSSS